MKKIKNYLINLKNYFKNIKFSDFMDFLIFNLSTFLIFFAWTRFIFKSTFPALITTLSVIVAINIFKSLFSSLKNNKTTLSKTKQKEIDNLSNYLLSLTNDESIEFVQNLYSDKKIINIKAHQIIFEQNYGITFSFEDAQIKYSKTLQLVKEAIINNVKTLGILCIKCDYKDKLLLENLKNINVNIIEIGTIHNKCKQNNIVIPNYFEQNPTKKIKFKQLFDISLDKKKAKNYFFSGLLVFFCSAIVKYNIYYVIMSSILFCLAILSLKKPQTTPPNNFFS